jgi:hypothetical protein
MSEHLENPVIQKTEAEVDPLELEVQVIKASPLVLKALEFYALREGATVEEYCARAVFARLQADEDQGGPTFD